MCQVAATTQKDGKKGKVFRPPTPYSTDGPSEFWAGRSPPFQIEEMQQRTASPINFLLSALVEAEADPSEKVAREYLPAHMLAPRLDGSYLGYPFEDRLALELRSAGLDNPRRRGDQGLFEQEIEHFAAELRRIQPAIDGLRQELITHLGEWQQDQRRRAQEQLEFVNLLRDIKRRTHKR
jgi:hypothetical protein